MISYERFFVKDPLLEKVLVELDDSDSTVVVPLDDDFNLAEEIQYARDILPAVYGAAVIFEKLQTRKGLFPKRRQIINVGNLLQGETLEDSFQGEQFYRFWPANCTEDRVVGLFDHEVGVQNLAGHKYKSAYVVFGETHLDLCKHIEKVFNEMYGAKQRYDAMMRTW